MSRFDDMVNGLRDEMDIPENVWKGYVQTLADLPDKNSYINKNRSRYEESRKNSRRRKVSAGMSYLKAAVLVLISVTLLGTGVYAAERYFGILDFLRGSGNEDLVPAVEAEDLIVPVTEKEQEKIEVTDGMIVDYTVKEAMCDSDSIYVVLEARAKEEGRYFFIPEDMTGEDQVNNWGGMESDMKAGEYAASKNLELLHVNAGIKNTDELGIGACAIYFQSVSDDVMDIMIECGKTMKEETLEVVCAGVAWQDGMASMEDIMRSEIRFTLTDISGSAATVYVPAAAAEIPGTGAVIEKAEVIQTGLGTYLEILYRNGNADEVSAPCFRLADENAGVEHKIRMGTGTEILDNGENFWRLSLEKTEFGDHIELEAYNAETKEVYGIVELVKQ